jgi:N-acetyl-anhydromuramoyl-L-alanine amidase
MQVDSVTGLLQGARFQPSPNCDPRPPSAVIEVLIIHSISLPPGEYGGPGIEQFFCNSLDPSAHPYYREIQELRVSAHLLIRRSGEIIQYVPFHYRAWHAGQSWCEGRGCVNDFSIGIELEGAEVGPFEDIQYIALRDCTWAIMRAYPEVSSDRIYGHSDIAPGRKTDPGPHFDWQRYLNGCSQMVT